MLVSVQNVTRSFLDEVVLRGVSLEIAEDDRIGLLGVNGAGKTTLLNMIAGALEPDEGSITRARGLQVGYLRQNDALDTNNTLDEEIRGAFAATYAVQADMNECYAALQKAPEDMALLAKLDKLTAQFDAMDGYRMEERINRVLNGLGFGGFDREGSVATLSGGEKMRFAIAKMLLQAPALLILDEPTNHLDFNMLSWLEEYLGGYKGAVLVVSHDRYFLDAVAKDVCEIERTELTRYKGGYSSFVVQKAERRRAAMKAWEKQQEEIAHMEDYVRRNMARASTTGMAKSRQKALDKMERLEKPKPEPKGIALRFTYDVEPFSTVLQCEGLGVYVGDEETGRQLYSDVELVVKRGEKIALVGENGVGKSTFLKAVQNLVEHTGRVQWGGNVRLGYFDQELAGLDMESTVMEAVHSRYPQKTEFEIRSALGRLLLEGDAVHKKVRELSGANRAKVAFAILEMRRANVLLLDEPTNHLDYRAKEVLEQALLNFEGTLLVVSHDRYFLRRVPHRILEMRSGGFENYVGNYDDYLSKKQQQAPTPTEKLNAQGGETPEEKMPQGNYRSKAQRAADTQRRTALAAAEKEVARLEAEVEELNTQLASPEVASDYEKLAELGQALEKSTAALEQAMEVWLELSGDE